VQSFFLKIEVVEKLRRNRPLNSLKAKCREAAVRSRGEASQACKKAKESCGETHFHFMDYTRKNGRSKSSEEILRSSEDC
jgi:hypothetical protein